MLSCLLAPPLVDVTKLLITLQNPWDQMQTVDNYRYNVGSLRLTILTPCTVCTQLYSMAIIITLAHVNLCNLLSDSISEDYTGKLCSLHVAQVRRCYTTCRLLGSYIPA